MTKIEIIKNILEKHYYILIINKKHLKFLKDLTFFIYSEKKVMFLYRYIFQFQKCIIKINEKNFEFLKFKNKNKYSIIYFCKTIN